MKGITFMSKKERGILRKKRGLRCPVCRKFVDNPSNLGDVDLTEEDRLLLPQAGDLTECCHCEAMLEYGGDVTLLTLHPAPQKRVDAFNALTRDTPDEPNFPELITYVMKYRQMPVQRQCVTD
jgi:hypothetical protein